VFIGASFLIILSIFLFSTFRLSTLQPSQPFQPFNKSLFPIYCFTHLLIHTSTVQPISFRQLPFLCLLLKLAKRSSFVISFVMYDSSYHAKLIYSFASWVCFSCHYHPLPNRKNLFASFILQSFLISFFRGYPL